MITPPFLKPGHRVGIVATARRIDRDSIEIARKTFENWGLVTVLSPNLFSENHSYLAGDDHERSASLQQMLDDPTLNAIVCARGGYGTTRIVDEIDFSGFKKYPKWVVGFSDVTALHLQLSSIGYESIHGTMPVLFGRDESKPSVDSLRSTLFGEGWKLVAAPSIYNRPGIVTGTTIGGNLSLLVDSLGTKHALNGDGKILVIEEIEEYLYKIDRMIVQLKRSGIFEQLSGLIVGYFTDLKDSDLSFGEGYQEIIKYHTRNYTFPVAFNFLTGHESPNFSWVSGSNSRLKVTSDQSELVSVDRHL